MKEILIQYLPYIAGAFEVTLRAIPTKKNYSVIHAVLRGLLFVSNLFDNRKKSINDTVKVIIFFIITSTLISCGITKNLECVSKKQISITVIDKNGNYTTSLVTYCDTIRIKNKVVDSTTRVKFIPTKEVKETN